MLKYNIDFLAPVDWSGKRSAWSGNQQTSLTPPKSKEDSSKWIEMSFYQDENRYNECIKVINLHEKIQNLYVNVLSLIVSKTEVTEGNYEQVFVNV